VASKWALIAAAGIGGCATAPSSQCACRPAAVSGKPAVEPAGVGLAAGLGAGESQPAAAIAAAAATAMAVAAAARSRPAVLADLLQFM
jgi:hypothetical protein